MRLAAEASTFADSMGWFRGGRVPGEDVILPPSPPLSLSRPLLLSRSYISYNIPIYNIIYINTDIDYPITANFRVESPILSFN